MKYSAAALLVALSLAPCEGLGIRQGTSFWRTKSCPYAEAQQAQGGAESWCCLMHNKAKDRMSNGAKKSCAAGMVHTQTLKMSNRKHFEAHQTAACTDGRTAYWVGSCRDCGGMKDCGEKACRKVAEFLPKGFKIGDRVPCEPCNACYRVMVAAGKWPPKDSR